MRWMLGLALGFSLLPHPSGASPAVGQGRVPVEIEVVPAREGGTALRGKVILLPVKPNTGEGLSVELNPAAGTRPPLSTTLPLGGSWEAILEVPGYWASRRAFEAVGTDPVRVRLDAWPLGAIEGRVRLKGQKLPPKIFVSTLSAPKVLGRPEAPQGLLECPVDAESGLWRCELPAAVYDLALGARGFIPHHRWGFTIPIGKAAGIGDLELVPGSSISGWVVVSGGAIDSERCKARLVPLTAPGAEIGGALGLAQTIREIQVGREGLFQFAGIPSGSFVVEIEQPGYAPARSAPVVLSESGEARFLPEPVTLVRPLALSFSIRPSLDGFGRPWKLSLTRADASQYYGVAGFEGDADAEGRLTARGQFPGTYLIEVRDSRGNRVFSNRDIPLENEEERVIEVEFVELEGVVRLGDSPLAAGLWFGGRHGAVSIALDSDAKGRFSGVLPRAGRWTVEVVGDAPRVRSKVIVEITSDRDGRAEVEIELPDTRVQGRVVDEKGRPAPGAEIVAFAGGSQDPPVLQEADGAGEFELRGLSEGTLTLAATGRSGSAAGWESDSTTVQVVEGTPLGRVTLVLREETKVSGLVVSPSGPVGGATVFAFSQDLSGVSGGRATTDSEGAFSVPLAKSTRLAIFIVAPPGFALQAFQVVLDGRPVRLPVVNSSGTLEISGTGAHLEAGGSLLIFQNGHSLPTPFLQLWSRSQGGTSAADATWTIPSLVPGDYQVCASSPGPSSSPAATAQQGACDQGRLEPGESLRLQLRTPETTGDRKAPQ